MTKRHPPIALVLALPALCAWGGQATFRSGVTLVRVDVSVTRDGIPVSGLTAANFELRDNGVRQRIDRVLAEEVPLAASLVLDSSKSVAGVDLQHLKSAANAFLDGLAKTDQAALIGFSHQVVLRQPLTSDFGSIRRAIDGVAGAGSTALVDALYAAIRLRDAANDRAVAVVFSDGLDNMSWLTPSEVVEAARRSDVIVYAVARARGGAGTAKFDLDDERFFENALLKNLAHQTGGRVYNAWGSDKLKDVFVHALREIRARYVLAYYPEGVDRAGWHKLDVRLKDARGDVRARPGYFAATPAPEGQ